MPDTPLGRANTEIRSLIRREILQEHDDLLGHSPMARGLELIEAVEKDVGARENLGRPTRLERPRSRGHPDRGQRPGLEKDVGPGQVPVTPVSVDQL